MENGSHFFLIPCELFIARIVLLVTLLYDFRTILVLNCYYFFVVSSFCPN